MWFFFIDVWLQQIEYNEYVKFINNLKNYLFIFFLYYPVKDE